MKKLWKKNQIMITALALMIAIAGYLNFMGKKVDKENLFTTSAQFEQENPELNEQTAETSTSNDNEQMVMVDNVLDGDQLSMNLENTDEYDALTDIDSMDSEDEMVYSDYLDEDQAENIVKEGDSALLEEGENTASLNEYEDEGIIETSAGSQSAQVTEDYDGETPGEAVFTSGVGLSSIENANLMKEQTREKNKEALLSIINSDTLDEGSKQEAIDSMITLTDLSQKECSAQILLEAKGFIGAVVSITGEQADVVVKAATLSESQRAQIEDIVSRKTGIEAQNIIISPVNN